MPIAIASDHGGYLMKEAIKKMLKEKNIAVCDFGTDSEVSCDYPVFAEKAAKAVASGECKLGILICGTGIGMSIVANKIKGIRAAVVGDTFSAKYTRLHNDANILCLGARVTGIGLAENIVDIFINTQFEGGRHKRRIDMIKDIEERFGN